MEWYYIASIILISIILLISLLSYILFLFTFYSKKKKNKDFKLPPGKIYIPFKDRIIDSMKYTESLGSKDFYITSFDGLKLHGKYYECKVHL